MIIKLNKLNLEFLKRKKMFNQKLKLKLKKSLINNQNQNKFKNIYISTLKQLKYNCFKNKQKNRCLFSGRTKAIHKHFGFGRHYLNKLAFFGKLNNISIKS